MLNDKSPMPFGKFKGRPMSAVSPSHLHWLWENWDGGNDNYGVMAYIKESMDAIKMEIPDKIWSKK